MILLDVLYDIAREVLSLAFFLNYREFFALATLAEHRPAWLHSRFIHSQPNTIDRPWSSLPYKRAQIADHGDGGDGLASALGGEGSMSQPDAVAGNRLNTSWQLICAYFLVCLTVLTILCTLRIASLESWRKFKRVSLARKLILLTLLDSWLFTFASALVLFGIGSALSQATCELGIWSCILVNILWTGIVRDYSCRLCLQLYASSKIMIYLFLMERLRIVHADTMQDVVTLRERFASWWFRGAAVLLVGWFGVAVVMCVGRNAVLKDNGECKIGLKLYSTVPMLAVDAIVNIYLTAGFVAPIIHAGFAQAKGLVKQSCTAAVAALVTSFANILALAIMHGHQMSYICLSSCVFDGKFRIPHDHADPQAFR